MKKIACVVIAAVMLVLCFTLFACGSKYSSHYSSSAMVEETTSTTASVSFGTFSGVYVIQLKNTSGEEAVIDYNATLEEGKIKVYYDFNDEKLDLLELGAGDSSEGKTEAFTGNKTIYIIIESDGKCGACSFSFALKKAE